MFFKAKMLTTTLCLTLCASAASAETLMVENRTDSYVTVSVDGAYGCNTAASTTCTIPVSAGRHVLRAVRSDTGRSITTTVDIPVGGGKKWTLMTRFEQ